MESFLINAKAASPQAATLNAKQKNSVLLAMAQNLKTKTEDIIAANSKDIEFAKANGLSDAMIDRLFLDEARVASMADGVAQIAALPDPIGRVLDGWIAPSGIKINKVSIPIGVVACIYESRPNVTADVGALCFKSGNVAVLKGGKEAAHSNAAIARILQETLEEFGLSPYIIALLPDSSREAVLKLAKMSAFVDVIIPRGGEALIKAVCEAATVPVIKHDKGVCHLYIDKDADEIRAISIAINAKVQRPSACNAIETLLIDESVAANLLPRLKEAFDEKSTEIVGCEKTCQIIDCAGASLSDWDMEYLANKLSIKVVNGVEEAVLHIRKYSSGHSDAIITQNYDTAEYFLNQVDSACVYLNASTRFTDGGEFGFGAEVGVSTNKLHSRGPMGINDLTTYKYKIYGEGHIRS
ncbi:MAG: hypothetical protein RL154_607 [Pseudomonadota bacterium]|jgi:glutamate-5-semialdehyde dehydrogenase